MEHQQVTQETLSYPNGCIIMDGSGVACKGTESAGIARQDRNETGKIDNRQLGIYLAYSSPKDYTLLYRRLYLPGKWFTPEYAARDQRYECLCTRLSVIDCLCIN